MNKFLKIFITLWIVSSMETLSLAQTRGSAMHETSRKASTFLAPKSILSTSAETPENTSNLWNQYFKKRWKNIGTMALGAATLSGIVNLDVLAEMFKGVLAWGGATYLFYQGAKEQLILKQKDFHAPEKDANRLELKAFSYTLMLTRLLSYLWLTKGLEWFSLQAMTFTFFPWIACVWIAILIPASYFFARNKNYILSRFSSLQLIPSSPLHFLFFCK
jgi:hypothetical protein